MSPNDGGSRRHVASRALPREEPEVPNAGKSRRYGVELHAVSCGAINYPRRGESDRDIILGAVLRADGSSPERVQRRRPLDVYLHLRQQQRDRPGLFYRALIEHTSLLMPYLYTPTVGEACQEYHRLAVPTYGVTFRADDRRAGTVEGMVQMLIEHCRSHCLEDVKIIVVTDGERILGLGDLGANGMGISEGKSLLYTAAAGVPPQNILPMCIDVGSNNEQLLADSLYSGIKSKRLGGSAYDGFVGRVLAAVKSWRPHVVLQFEDFANHNAFTLLEKYRSSALGLCCFNDDIQGTASIALSGLLAALRVSEQRLDEQVVLFLGAGEAGAGIGELIAKGLEAWCGIPLEEGRKRCWFIDSKGLITNRRGDLQEHKKAFAHSVDDGVDEVRELAQAIRALKPTALIGVSTQPGSFTREAIEMMAAYNERPIIFPLSNPTSKSECTFEDAWRYTHGRVLFASGSPFPSVGSVSPSQANNAYIFPAVGYAASLCQAREITDEAFLIAAKALSEMASEEELAAGSLFPNFGRIREVSRKLMGRVAAHMCDCGLGEEPRDFEEKTAGGNPSSSSSWEAYASSKMYQVPVCLQSKM
jgi:malate dehydrogenase (oxaloacetate-decarboxylating)(NADP+)